MFGCVIVSRQLRFHIYYLFVELYAVTHYDVQKVRRTTNVTNTLNIQKENKLNII
jgi:hypothetical protein